MKHRGDLFLSVVGPTFTETSWLDWGWFIFAIILSIGLAWLGHYLLSATVNRLQKMEDELIYPLVQGMRTPFMILIVALGLLIGSSRIHLQPTLSDFRWSVIEALLIIAGTLLFVSIFELIALRVQNSLTHDEEDPYLVMSTTILRRCVRIIAMTVLGIFILQNLFAWNVTSLIGGVGLVALAFSLAAKDAVQNLFGALTIFANRPFLVNDWVVFQGEIGEVQDVSIQVTKIRLLTGEIWSVPNMKFVNEPVENLSLRKYLRRELDIAITYDSGTDKVKKAVELLDDILRSEEVVKDGQCDIDEHPPHVNFSKFESDYLNIRVDYWYMMDPSGNKVQRDTDRGWFSYLEHCSIVNRAILERFNEEGIDFAFPSQTLYLTDDKNRKLEATINMEDGSSVSSTD